MSEVRHIAFAADAAYEPPLRVLWMSLFAHHAPGTLVLHLIHDGWSQARQASLLEFAARHGARACLHAAAPAWTDGLPVNADFPSALQYYRLYVDAILPEDVGRALYLDVDTLACGNLEPLFETDLGGAVAGAAVDLDSRAAVARLGLPPDAAYFNSGVLLIDRRGWSQGRVVERVRQYLRTHAADPARWRYPDQDALNVALAGRWTPLAPRWNCYAVYRLHYPNDLSADRRAACRAPGILHFTGPEKPWLGSCAPPYRRHYRALARRAGVRVPCPWGWHAWMRRWTKERELHRMRVLHKEAGLGDDF
ncbi:MAG: glycosyltransferase family 8 protein [Kiritimatiellae bacterium]|nr:glycosyltransferase family 8 protein [Kiritimatiellia bacterium]